MCGLLQTIEKHHDVHRTNLILFDCYYTLLIKSVALASFVSFDIAFTPQFIENFQMLMQLMFFCYFLFSHHHVILFLFHSACSPSVFRGLELTFKVEGPDH